MKAAAPPKAAAADAEEIREIKDMEEKLKKNKP